MVGENVHCTSACETFETLQIKQVGTGGHTKNKNLILVPLLGDNGATLYFNLRVWNNTFPLMPVDKKVPH